MPVPPATPIPEGCRCRFVLQPFARPMIHVGARLTCRIHRLARVWDGVAFIPRIDYNTEDGS